MVSNDVLYGQDPKFLAEVNNMCTQLMERILEQLRQLGLQQQHRWQAHGALELLERVARYADLGREKTFQLCVNLWNLARKQESLLAANYLVRAPFHYPFSRLLFVVPFSKNAFLLQNLVIATLKTIEAAVNESESWCKTQGQHLTRLIQRLQG